MLGQDGHTVHRIKKTFQTTSSVESCTHDMQRANWQVKTDERMIQIGADLMQYGHATLA
jgi:hypothetical protein